MATSPASAAAAGGSVTTTATATMAGSHVLMIVDGYSKLKEVLRNDDGIKSDTFRAGGHSWFIEFQPSSKHERDIVSIYLYRDDDDDGDATARYELSLLNRDGHIISSIQSFYTFKRPDDNIEAITELNASRLLGDSFQIRCVLSVVNEVTAVVPPDIHRHLGGLLASQQVGGDVTFQVGGELFAAHKYILAARSPVFMADLFGPPGKENAAHVRIDGIEPRVFRALLHFVYTDTLADRAVNEGDDGDKVAMAQGLLVAADRYGMERLKSICGDVLCNHIDARTAMPLLQLADSHGCRRLKEACIRAIKDLLAKVGGAAP
ncbi:unnamed protein product [Urochloa decumbens]|uniref:Uncharacterized protein n=1 Tax=Urochloa decumbens TaxID=240449 RepID=A0ABC9B4E2_9POAL